MNNIDNKDDSKEIKEEVSSFDVVREKIKERPVNKKKLAKRMLSTAGMAVMFGAIACLAFLLSEPLFDKLISNNEDDTVLTQVKLSEPEADESQENISVQIDTSGFDEEYPELSLEETPIEDLAFDDNTVSDDAVSNNSLEEVYKREIELDDYQLLYRKMYSMSSLVSRSMVTVTGSAKSKDILMDEYLDTDRTTGLIVAEDGKNLLILGQANDKVQDNITVTFCNGDANSADIKAVDSETGLAIYSVSINGISPETREEYSVATLGNSNSKTLLGSPVIVMGNLLSTGDSVWYGMITSMDGKMYCKDVGYQLITSNILAEPTSSGIVFNIKGQVVGYICQKNNGNNANNLITAYGITGIKKLIEDMSNSNERMHLGLYVKDITSEAMRNYNIPAGVYVSKVEMNSNAMNVGIVSGDIITAFNGNPINSVNDYSQKLWDCNAGQEVELIIMRQNGSGYAETKVMVEVEGK